MTSPYFLLKKLIALGDDESNTGLFRVSLDYDNYHDGARVLNGNGEVIGECYDPPPPEIPEEAMVEWQFHRAIEAAEAKEPTVSPTNARPPEDTAPRGIGEIGNFYGGLSVKTENGKHYWSIENYNGENWEEIPPELFYVLNAFKDSNKQSTD